MKRLFLGSVAAVLFATSAVAQSFPNFPQFTGTGWAEFTSATTPGVFVELYIGGGVAGHASSDCTTPQVTSNDTATHTITIRVYPSNGSGGTLANPAYTSTVGISAQAGSSGTPAQPLFTSTLNSFPIDKNSNPFIRLMKGDQIQVTYATAVTGGDVLGVAISCSDYLQ